MSGSGESCLGCTGSVGKGEEKAWFVNGSGESCVGFSTEIPVDPVVPDGKEVEKAFFTLGSGSSFWGCSAECPVGPVSAAVALEGLAAACPFPRLRVRWT